MRVIELPDQARGWVWLSSAIVLFSACAAKSLDSEGEIEETEETEKEVDEIPDGQIPDNSLAAPVISITAPESDAQIEGLVRLSASITNAVEVETVEFEVAPGDLLVAGSELEASYDALVDFSTFLDEQEVTITALATTSDGQIGEDSVTVFVRNPLLEGIAALWRLDEGQGTFVGDASGNDHTGTVYGAAWSDGISGGCLEFDGVDDHVDVDSVDIGGSEITIAMWVFVDPTTDPDSHMRFISKTTDGSSPNHIFMLSNYNERAVRVRLKIDGTTRTTATGANRVPAGVWTHVAATYDGAAIRLWVNGQIQDLEEVVGYLSPNPLIPTRIGANPSGDSRFKGAIDDVRIYDRALSSEELQQLVSTYQPS